jgi:hypothetical protein
VFNTHQLYAEIRHIQFLAFATNELYVEIRRIRFPAFATNELYVEIRCIRFMAFATNELYAMVIICYGYNTIYFCPESEVRDFGCSSADMYIYVLCDRTAELYTSTGKRMYLISGICFADNCIECIIHLLKTCTFFKKKCSPNGGLTLIQLAKSPIM